MLLIINSRSKTFTHMHGSTTTPTSSAPPSSSIGILSEPLPNPSLPSRLARDFYLSELAELLRLGVPFAITTLLDMLQLEIALAFAGRSPGTRCTPNGRHGLNGTDVIHNTSIDEGADGTAELAAAGLAFSLFALEVECPAIALSTAFAGNFGAAYGAKNFRSLRVHFQRSVLVAAIVVFGVAILIESIIIFYFFSLKSGPSITCVLLQFCELKGSRFRCSWRLRTSSFWWHRVRRSLSSRVTIC